MIKAVIFDCFGVIIADALSVMTSELHQTNPKAMNRVHTLLNQANTGQITSEESSREIAEIFGLSYETYRTQIATNEIKDEELLGYIQGLRGNYKTALLSNIPKGSLSRRFSDDELRQYFDEVVASGEIGYAKPEAQAYEIVAERLGVRLDECVFTDDREPYCEGAQAVGMKSIVYQDFQQFRAELEQLLANTQ